jgi:hypothetical protein
MNKKKEPLKFTGDSPPNEESDLDLKVLLALKRVLAGEREESRELRFRKKLESKGATAQRKTLLDLLGRLKDRRSAEKRKHLSTDHRRKISRLLKEISNEP